MSVSRRCVLFWIGTGPAMLAACRRRRSPEDQVRDTIDAVARAVEEKDAKALRALVSERYRDSEEHDRAEVLATLQILFRRHPRIHLLTRVNAVEVFAPGEARATVVVAMAGMPMKALEDLPRVRADINRFDLTLLEQPPTSGTWQVASATWQAASPEDLF